MTEGKREGGFAAIYLPGFGLQAVARLEKGLEGKALVLMGDSGRKAVAVQVNARARTAGVTVGMTAPQVVARSPDAVLRSRSSAGEESAREALIAAAFRLSPRVEETAEGLCTIDLKGTSSLPNSSLLIHHSLRKLGLAAKIGFARNPWLSYLAARRADPVLEVNDETAFLAELPLAMADPSPQLGGILEQWGIRTLGELGALPRQEIAKRLGEEGIALWDRAVGREERVLRLTTLSEAFEEGMELEDGMETLEPLLFILRRFIGQLALRLEAVYQVAEEVKLELGLSDGSNYQQDFRLPEPTRDPDLLFRMLHTHLEGVRTEFPIVKIYLWMKPCKPVSKQQDLFEASVRDAYGFSDTLARLVAVAGSENVGSPRLEPTHRPDAFRLVPLANVRGEKVKEGSGKAEKEEGMGPVKTSVPMRRYRPPLAVRVWIERGRPVHIQTECFSERVREALGPWRLSGNWWDQHRWARDEWDVECGNGGVYRLVREGKWWYLEGEYG